MEPVVGPIKMGSGYKVEPSWTENNRKQFNVSWLFSVGWTSNSRNFKKAFPYPHPIQTGIFRSRAICRTHPMKKCIRKWKKTLFQLATRMFSHLLPTACDSQYVIQFSKVDSESLENETPKVDPHQDEFDVAPQFMVNLGTWTGAKIVCYSEDSTLANLTPIASFDQPRRLLAFDGRLYHGVVFDNFEGVRYSVILYYSWKENQFETDPLLTKPYYADVSI
jgi:hypothetical protein